MMNTKIFYPLFFLLLSSVAFSQTEVNQWDKNGKRHGVWTKKYNNGNIRYTGEFKHGKEVGTFRFFAITGEKHPVVIKEFNADNAIAEVRFYSEKGVLESKGMMEGKKRIGEWLYYFKDGKTVLSVENYRNGLLDGKMKIFYPSGKLTEISHYKNGKLHGNCKKYSEKGDVIEDLTYKEGMMHGPAVIYNKSGEVFARGDYENGIKTGIWELNIDGEMIKTTPDKIEKKRN